MSTQDKLNQLTTTFITATANKVQADLMKAATENAVTAAQHDFDVLAPARASAIIQASQDVLVAAKQKDAQQMDIAIASNLAMIQARKELDDALNAVQNPPAPPLI